MNKMLLRRVISNVSKSRMIARRALSTRQTDFDKALHTKEEVDAGLERMRIAQEKFLNYSQSQVDNIFESVSYAIKARSLELAKYAVEESGIGLVEDKVLKNIYATEHSLATYLDTKTVGVIDSDPFTGISKIAEPVGPICAILPCTNPTATTIMKSLYSIKTRNCVAFLPHPRTKLCSIYTANLIQHYAKMAGAPDDIIMSAMPSRELSDYVMKHHETKFLLATGGSDMVKACYSVGKPAIGVGPGNTPVLIDGTFNLKEAVNSIMIGKTFDWGVPCITEQSAIIVEPYYDKAKKLFTQRGVYFLESGEDKKKLAEFFMPGGERVSADIVGKSPQVIAQSCGIHIPNDALAIGIEISRVGDDEIFSHEKLSPLLSLYKAKTFEDGLDTAIQLAHYGGPGHSSSIFSTNDEHLRLFQNTMPTYHVNVNMPAIGGIGIRYNSNIQPSMTVGCGSKGGSMASVNVGPRELIHIKHVVRKVEHEVSHRYPLVYDNFDDAIYQVIRHSGRNKVLVIMDPSVQSLWTLDITLELAKIGVSHIENVSTNRPSWDYINEIVKKLDTFRPTIIFAVGDANTIDTAKLLRLHIENPMIPVERLVAPFIENHWRKSLMKINQQIPLVVVPTIAAVGTEMTPFVQNITFKGERLPVWIDELRPDVVVHRLDIGVHVFKERAYLCGFKALLQSIESFVSATSTEESRRYALHAIKDLFLHLGEDNDSATQHIFSACGQAGKAISSTGLGTATAMAMSFSSRFNVPVGVALAIFMPHVIRYNLTSAPVRIAATPDYPFPKSNEQYSELAEHIGVSGGDKVSSLVLAIIGLRSSLGLPASIAELGVVTDDEFNKIVETLAEGAFGNQLSNNPRMALIPELKDLFIKSYHS